jgi:hypothetical protein
VVVKLTTTPFTDDLFAPLLGLLVGFFFRFRIRDGPSSALRTPREHSTALLRLLLCSRFERRSRFMSCDIRAWLGFAFLADVCSVTWRQLNSPWSCFYRNKKNHLLMSNHMMAPRAPRRNSCARCFSSSHKRIAPFVCARIDVINPGVNQK